jgi:hypothetical protein
MILQFLGLFNSVPYHWLLNSYETELVCSLPQEYHCIPNPVRDSDALDPVKNVAV